MRRHSRGGIMKQKQKAKQAVDQETKYTELLDLRTHLTVAILAAAQLKRKSPQADDIARLQGYLDRSLIQLQQDIASLESLVVRLDKKQIALASALAPRSRRFPPRWVGMGMVFVAAKLRQSFVPSQPQAAHPTV